MVFSSSHVWMWELDYKHRWAPKKSCFWTVVLEKTLEIPLDCKKFKSVNPKENQSWIFLWMADAEVEKPILGHLFWKTDSLEKTLVLGKIELRRRRDLSRMIWLCSITDSMDVSLTRFWGLMMDRESWHAEVHGAAKNQTRLSDWIVWVPDQNLNFLHSSYSGLVALLLQYWDLRSVDLNQQLGEKKYKYQESPKDQLQIYPQLRQDQEKWWCRSAVPVMVQEHGSCNSAGARPRGATPLPRWGAASSLCWSSHEDIHHVQGKRNPNKTVGTERGHQRAERMKPQSQTTRQSDHTDHSLI